jgi:hypothetical protein
LSGETAWDPVTATTRHPPTWRERLFLAALLALTLPLVTPKLRAADEIEYFAYLRSWVLDGDLDFANEYQHFYDRDPKGLAQFKTTFLDMRDPVTGRCINFGPMGSAVLWGPFYLLVHAGLLLARLLGASTLADGFSGPYIAAVSYASAFYGLLGFGLIHDGLRRYGGFDERAARLSVVAMWLGTPALYYMTIAPGFSHAPSLFVVSWLLWLWLGVRNRADGGLPRHYALIGVAGGLAGLVREQDVLFLSVPCLWVVWQAVRQRDWKRGLLRLCVVAVTAWLVFLPQLFAYRALFGGFHPSGIVREKMRYWSPHFLEILFDPGRSLFLWSPLLLLSVLGLGLALHRRRDAPTVLFALAFVLQVWICGSLSSWTQAGAFGMRRFISATPAFAWGLAVLLGPLCRGWRRFVAVLALTLCVWWSLSLMVQFGTGLMNRKQPDWPSVAVNQVVGVPPRLARWSVLFFTDRERLVHGVP